MSKIFELKQVRETRQLRPEGRQPVVAWTSKELKASQADAWIKSAIADKEHEAIARSLWAHFPNLKTATLQLASFITPKWPTKSGGALLEEAIRVACKKTQVIVDRGEPSGAIIGAYLGWLSICVTDVARLGVFGIDKTGECVRWKYFTETLADWAHAKGVSEIVAHVVDPEPDTLTMRGLRLHLIARICHHVDAALTDKYVPPHIVLPERFEE